MTTIRRGFAVCLLGMLFLAPTVLAQIPPPKNKTVDDQAAENVQRLQEGVSGLTDIRQSLISKRQELEKLQKALKTATEEDQKQAIQKQLEDLNKSVGKLNNSFEQIAIGGLDLTVFSEIPEQKFDWQDELIKIIKPILNSLEDLTEKPRKIEELRGEIIRYQDQLTVIGKALDSIRAFQQQSPPPITREQLETIATEWQQRKTDAEQALEIARFQLASLQGQTTSPMEAVKEAARNFVQGRGLTLGLALATAVIVWLLLRGLLWLFQKRPGRSKDQRRVTGKRLVLYSYRLITIFLVIVAVLTVFYIRGDLLLLALGILGLVVVILGLRQALPRYVAEMRLLLDIGTVRIGERVIYNGLPMQVKAINVYSVLRNPDLEGVIRLPLAALNDMVSRPCREESWFPCRSGEYVLLPDGKLGMVLRQTVELVQLKTAGSIVQFSAADFLQLNVRNLSREGFGLAVTFGIDYRHQALCLDQVPQRFRRALTAAFGNAGLSQDLDDMVVDFKEAGPNSLDYLIFVTMNGRAASSYFKIGRLVQQVCVDVCNQEDWGIPFAQLTVHQGDGFNALRVATSSATQEN